MHACARTHTLQDMHVYTHTHLCTHAHKQCVGHTHTQCGAQVYTHLALCTCAHIHAAWGTHTRCTLYTRVCAHTHCTGQQGSCRPWGRQGPDPVHHGTGRGTVAWAGDTMGQARDAMGQARDATGDRRASTGNREHLEPRWDRQEEERTVEWAAPPAPHPLHCATPPLPWWGAPPPAHSPNRQPLHMPIMLALSIQSQQGG